MFKCTQPMNSVSPIFWCYETILFPKYAYEAEEILRREISG